ncbi:MAG: S9 family peptidase [Deltaproteobacteria bacterium]|nr:S9 family peptidase [Deltaproteobacteria bacterium]MCB9489247.1 S9 family peptidase [Deltaproteobacteria bacterium]
MKHTLRNLVAAALVLALASSAFAGEPDIRQYLQIKSATGGTWSPDGRYVAYLYDESGTDQVWQVDTKTGATRALTHGDERVSFVQYSPTRSQMIFGMDAGGNERTQLYLMSQFGTGVERLTNDDDAIHIFGGFSHDGAKIAYSKNTRDARFFDVYVRDLDTGKERLVLKHDAYNEPVAFSGDDKYLVVSTWESNFNNDLTLIELATLKDGLLTPHTGNCVYTNVVWPKGEDDFYLVSNKGREWAKLAIYRLDKRLLDYQDVSVWDTNNLAVSADNRHMSYTLNTHGASKPILIDLRRKKYLGEIDKVDGVISRMAWSPSGDRLLYAYESPTEVPNLWIYDVAARKSTRLTNADTAGVDVSTFIAPNIEMLSGYRGMQVPTWLYLPPTMKKDGKNAVVIYAHGGPESQSRPWFGRVTQYLLASGVALAYPNVRGSDGYGKHYLHLDDGRNRLDSLRDYAHVAESLKDLGYFDSKKIGIYGGSYGGYVVLGSVTEYPELYAAGVSFVGIANFVTFLENTGAWRRSIREAEYGSLKDDRDFLESISPVHKADRIKAALMIVQGANDPRVPASEAEQMVAAMKANGRPVEYLLYADEGHGLSKLKNQLDAYPKVVSFLKKYLVGGEATKDAGNESEPRP